MIRDSRVDHEELTHLILAQNFIPKSKEEILEAVKEYFKENDYSEDEEFGINREAELERVMDDITATLGIPVFFHLISEPDFDWYIIWKGSFTYEEGKFITVILDEDFNFEVTGASQLVDKLAEVQAEYITMADKLAKFVENTLAKY